jgi:hypothetical protein
MGATVSLLFDFAVFLGEMFLAIFESKFFSDAR